MSFAFFLVLLVLTVVSQAMLVQLKYILEFDKRMGLLTNQITLASFSLILRDSINLYGALMQGKHAWNWKVYVCILCVLTLHMQVSFA